MTFAAVYKLLSEADWDAAVRAGTTACAVDFADGYVHLSTRQQVEETARRYFCGAGRVRLLRFAAGSLGPLQWEASRGGDLFPHLYGPLPLAHADAAWWLLPDAGGRPVFPAVF